MFKAMKTKLPIGILGATGMVGQRFIQLLENHPWFEVAWLAASDRSSGKLYGEAAKWRLDTPLPGRIANMTVAPAEPEGAPKVIFAALDAAIAREIGAPVSPNAGCAVVSNSSAYRMAANVPLVIPEINAEHLHLIEEQPSRRSPAATWSPIPTAPPSAWSWLSSPSKSASASSRSSSPPCRPSPAPAIPACLHGHPRQRGSLHRQRRRKNGGRDPQAARQARRATPSRRSPRASRALQPRRRRGRPHGERVDQARQQAGPATREDLLAAWAEFRPLAGQGLPTAPDQPVEWAPQNDRPQPRLDRNRGNGMAVTVGRLRPCGVLDWKFTVLSHNTIRGAAGAAILNAELLASLGKLEPVAAAAARA
jgi:aspartate-semialdehyde dehydrogenase